MIIDVPLRIESTPNLRECWQARMRRAREHKSSTWFALKAAKAPHAMPCTVTLTRIAPRTLDGDNLQAGMKNVRDGVALWLHIDDADERVTWKYAQAKGEPKEYGLRIEVAPC